MHGAIEQNDGDARLVEGRHDPQVAGVARGSPSSGAKNTPSTRLRDVLPARAHAAAVAPSAVTLPAAPQERVRARAAARTAGPGTSGSKISVSGRSGTRMPNVQSAAAAPPGAARTCPSRHVAPPAPAPADPAPHARPLFAMRRTRPRSASLGTRPRRPAVRTRCPCAARRRPTWYFGHHEGRALHGGDVMTTW